MSHSGTGEGKLCGPGWIHAYEHPLIAVLLNPIHADFKSPRLWEAEGKIAIRDGQLKCGCRTLTTIREIPLPSITTEMRVRFAILCAKEVCAYPAWNAWADRWLSGGDRSEAAASASAARAYERASERAWATAASAWASASAWAAWASERAEAAEAAAEASAWASAWASAAAEAAAAAAEAAWAAAEMDVGHRIDFFGIAEKACSGLR